MFFQREHRNAIEGILGLGIIGILLISTRVYFMGNKPPEFAPADNPASDSSSLLTRTLTFNYLPVINFWLLLYPSVLSFDWSMDAVPLVESVFDYRNLFTLLFYATLCYVVCYIIKSLETNKISKDAKTAYTNGFKHSHKLTNGISNGHVANGFARNGNARHRHTTNNLRRSSSSSSDSDGESPQALEQSAHIIIISLTILILPFIPATNLFFYVGFVIAERILYIPSMGFCILVAYSINTVHQKYGAAFSESGGIFKKHLMHLLVGCLLLAYSVRTVQRNEDWSNEESLYKAGISVNPAKGWLTGFLKKI